MMRDPEIIRKPILHAKAQAGQAIVLVAMLMVILIGMLGLAIDGGGLYLLYRDTQNAVDAAALAAAYSLCTNGDVIANATESVRLNGFEDGVDGATVEVIHPAPASLGYTPTNHYVHVVVRAPKPSYFIQLLWGGDELAVTANAVSFCDPGSSGGSAPTDGYAFASTADPGECTGTPGWSLSGSQFTVLGNVWLPTIQGNVELMNPDTTNTDQAHVLDNETDIVGHIYIGGGTNQGANSGHQLQDPTNPAATVNLVEDTPASEVVTNPLIVNTAHGPVTVNTAGFGGDGTIDYDQAGGKPAIPWTMDYFRPYDSYLCDGPNYDNGGQCGLLQSTAGANYIDLTDYDGDGHDPLDNNPNNDDLCNTGNKFEAQDFQQGLQRPFPQWTGTTFADGIYYADCPIILERDALGANPANVTFIGEENIDITGNIHFSGYNGEPVLVSNYGDGATTPANCIDTGNYAIKFDSGGSHTIGPIFAPHGTVYLNGNDYFLDSCILARGFLQNGNDGSVYRCGGGTPTSGPPSVGVVR